MGLFCGTICQCKRRCKGYFSFDPALERGCKNACKSDSSITREKFLCSGNWIDQQVVIGSLGYDPCPGDNITIDDYLDPLHDREAEATKRDKMMPILGALGIVLILLVLIFFYIKAS